MGEIKSTLDLVMERTRHLSLSAEEKEAQQREDFAKRLQGLLQQYADGAIYEDELRDRMAALETETGIRGRMLAVEAVAHRIDPGHDNELWLALLEHLAPGIDRPLQDILAAFEAEQTVLLQTGQEQFGNRLARDHDIAGTAVVPNPRRDPATQNKLTALWNETKEKIEKQVQAVV